MKEQIILDFEKNLEVLSTTIPTHDFRPGKFEIANDNFYINGKAEYIKEESSIVSVKLKKNIFIIQKVQKRELRRRTHFKPNTNEDQIKSSFNYILKKLSKDLSKEFHKNLHLLTPIIEKEGYYNFFEEFDYVINSSILNIVCKRRHSQNTIKEFIYDNTLSFLLKLIYLSFSFVKNRNQFFYIHNKIRNDEVLNIFTRIFNFLYKHKFYLDLNFGFESNFTQLKIYKSKGILIKHIDFVESSLANNINKYNDISKCYESSLLKGLSTYYYQEGYPELNFSKIKIFNSKKQKRKRKISRKKI